MPTTTFAGHPLHPQLVSFPIGLFGYSLAMDVTHMLTGDRKYVDTAYHTMVGGFVSGLAAGAAGTMDYLAIPPDSKSKKTANLHGLLNLGVMGLYGLNLLLRQRQRNHVGVLPFLLSALGTAGLVASAWYGGELVYELGMRVKPLEEGQPAPDLHLPGDEKLARGFQKFEEKYAPADGPQA